MKGILLVATTGLVLAGCQTGNTGRRAMAEMNPTAGHTARGTVQFYETRQGVRVVAQARGLTPGKHGFHIHEKGDCSAPDATSAGGHFNPTGARHGGLLDRERHAGDFGNLTADASGNARLEFVTTTISFDGPNSIIGRSIIVHEKPDDGTTQNPPGNAGARIACGLIRLQ